VKPGRLFSQLALIGALEQLLDRRADSVTTALPAMPRSSAAALAAAMKVSGSPAWSSSDSSKDQPARRRADDG